MKKFFKRRIQKFKEQSLFGKILDLLLLVLIILLIIPGTRKELKTYGSKLRMYVTSVDEKEGSETTLEGKSSLEFVDSEGTDYTLSDYDNKPVFINYWATWCPPCRAEMPSLQRLYNKYGDQVHFLFITNESFSTVEKYFSEGGYDLPVYQIKSRPQGSFAYQVLPTSLLVSAEDKLIFRKVGAVNWQSDKIQKIFNKTASNE